MLFVIRCASVLAMFFALVLHAHAQWAKLPPEHIEDARSTTSMEIGETAYIQLSCALVSKEGEVFLVDGCIIESNKMSIISLKVVRQSDGYHLYLKKDQRLTRLPYIPSSEVFRGQSYTPVKEIHIEP